MRAASPVATDGLATGDDGAEAGGAMVGAGLGDAGCCAHAARITSRTPIAASAPTVRFMGSSTLRAPVWRARRVAGLVDCRSPAIDARRASAKNPTVGAVHYETHRAEIVAKDRALRG